MRLAFTIPLFVTMVAVAAGCRTASGPWIEAPLSQGTFFATTGELHEGDYQIPVPAGEALEFMLEMDAGETITYRWTTQVEPGQFTAEFHGHTIRQGEEPGTVMIYDSHQADREQGSLAAPFDGIHGWYFNNEGEQDIVVDLRVVGFYRLHEAEDD